MVSELQKEKCECELKDLLSVSSKKKFLQDSIEDYRLLIEFLMRYYPEIMDKFNKGLGRPIKTGLKVDKFFR